MSESSLPEQVSSTNSSPEFNLGEEASKKGLEQTKKIELSEEYLKNISFQKPETEEERTQRLWVEKSTLEDDRKKAEKRTKYERTVAVIENIFTKAVQSVGLIILVVALAKAVEVLLEEGTLEQKQRIAENTITLVLGGITGFSAGKVKQSPPQKDKP